MTQPSILVEELPAQAGRLGRITLNSPATLNSLTLDMVDQLQAQLDQWRTDDGIAAVLLDGSGDKAFCAGGDVQALYRSAIDNPGGPCDYAETFFAREYRMNYALHTYPKPLICWGNGIVMGGGLGLLAGCAHRVVTETTRIAMPEITIALFPDVGGSWFLNHMPGSVGRFLALTGASINGTDALFAGLADGFITNEHKTTLLAALCAQHWDNDPAANEQRVNHCLQEVSAACVASQPPAQLEPHLAVINELCGSADIYQVVDAIVQLETDDRWLAKARDGLAGGSPLAALWIDRQLQTTGSSTLKEVFLSELVLATNIVRYPEFAEGVRALLIDKDRQPVWQYSSISEVPEAVLDGFFQPPWPQNPLADL